MTRGVRQIVRFNWPAYAAAATAAGAGGLAVPALPAGSTSRALLLLLVGLACFWSAASLLASWIVYDRSPLTRWEWIREALGPAPRSWVNVHCGFDESTAALRGLLPGSAGRAWDVFDPAEMTEPSIRRARAAAATAGSEAVRFRQLPAPDASVDGALLLMSAHELRSDDARVALFGELRRLLARHGRVVVAEHLRDWANFLAFGPGCLHFHSRRTWHGCFARAGLGVRSEFSMTPFVRIFVLQRQR